MDPFLGEIRIFAGNYAPKGWALCNGQTLSIAQNTALYSLLGLSSGGVGKTTFGLPDLQGRAPMFWGSGGGGVSPRNLGEKSGSPTVTLNASQQPPHTHSLSGMAGGRGGGGATQTSPSNNAFGQPQSGSLYVNVIANVVAMSSSAIGQTGGNQPHNNMQPYLALSFIIALTGVYPTRS